MTDMAARDSIEIRFECPAEVVAVLDAESMAAGLSRSAYVVKLLSSHARERRHAASLLQRIDGGYPMEPDPRRKGSE